MTIRGSSEKLIVDDNIGVLSTLVHSSILKMATRNLYELDTVLATLLYAIDIGDKKLSIQTTKELIISDESDIAKRTLTFAWWLSEPTHIHISPSMTPKELLYGILISKHPFPSPYLPSDIKPPCAGTHIMPPPRSWKKLPTGWTPHMAGRLWSALQYDIKHKFPEHMTELVRPLLTKDKASVISLLNALNVPKFYIDSLSTIAYPLNERVLYHSFATQTQISLTTQNTTQWDSLWNESNGRCFQIQSEALAHWGVKSPSIERLIGPPTFVINNASNFWKTQVLNHNLTLQSNNTFSFPNDDLHESFYTLFPIDIPDEWSIAERKKSHGITIPEYNQNPWVVFFIRS